MSTISWKVISRGVNNDTDYLRTVLSFGMASYKEDWDTAILIYRNLTQKDKDTVILSSWMLPVAQNTNDHKFILELADDLEKQKKIVMHASLRQSVINSFIKSGDMTGAMEKVDLAIAANQKEATELAALRLKVVDAKSVVGGKRVRTENDRDDVAPSSTSASDLTSASASASASAFPIKRKFKRAVKRTKH